MPDVFGKKKIKDLETEIYFLRHRIQYLNDELDRVYKDIYGKSKKITGGCSGSADDTTFIPVWEKKNA